MVRSPRPGESGPAAFPGEEPLKEPPGEAVTADTFLGVFRDHPGSDIVVTAAGPAAPAGFAATSLTLLSAEPPTLSFAVARSAPAWRTLSGSARFMVHLPATDQLWLAARFTTSTDPFAALRWRAGPGGRPVIEGCAAYLSCELVQVLPVGDHMLVLARACQAWAGCQRLPSGQHRGSGAQESSGPRLTAPAGSPAR
jgi:flavin reductase (DIM6/NTAB) family NADH-FMN oxidoreductase RutF